MKNLTKKKKKTQKNDMNEYAEFFELGFDVLMHPLFIRQNNYFQHNTTTLFEHSILVAYIAYLVGSKLGLDTQSIVRGALLHDFFLYDWHTEGKKVKKPIHKKHGFKHAKYAYENASFYFTINQKEKDIITKHMFPLNIKPPIYYESWLVNFVDDYVTFSEYFKNNKNKYNNLIEYIYAKLKTS